MEINPVAIRLQSGCNQVALKRFRLQPGCSQEARTFFNREISVAKCTGCISHYLRVGRGASDGGEARTELRQTSARPDPGWGSLIASVRKGLEPAGHGRVSSIAIGIDETRTSPPSLAVPLRADPALRWSEGG